MKGIILSGGKGTRLLPLTKITSKQLLPVYDKQMIFYPLQTLIDGGIKDVLIIVAPQYLAAYETILGDGKDRGITISYAIQEEANGLPEAFTIGESFINGDNVTLILGDNLFEDDFSEAIRSFEKGARIFAKEVEDANRFGVIEFDDTMQALSIEEKPVHPKSSYAVTGLYIYDARVVALTKTLLPSARRELEIVDLHKKYLDLGELDVRIVKGVWEDAGTFDSLLRAGKFAQEKAHKNRTV